MRLSSSIAFGQSDGSWTSSARCSGSRASITMPEPMRLDGGVVAREHEEEAEAEQLLVGQLLAVDLGADERGHHVVARLRASLGEQLGEQPVDVAGGLREVSGLGDLEERAGPLPELRRRARRARRSSAR